MKRERGLPSPRGGGSERESAPGRGGNTALSASALTPHPATLAGVDPPPQGEGGRRAASSDLVLLGEFGRAHGLKGELRLKSHTGDPLAIATYGPLVDPKGRTYTIRNPRQAPGGAPEMLVVRVDGVATRETAELLNRVELFIARDKLPAADDDDEFLLADLIGCAVRTTSNDVIGSIVDVPNFGGGDLLEIKPATGGATAFLPFTKAFVPMVHIAERYVVAIPPEDLFAHARQEPQEPEQPEEFEEPA